MTENAYRNSTATLTDDERMLWGVNYQVEMDRHDLAAELADTVDPAATAHPAPTPVPVERGTRAAHRVALRGRSTYRR